MMRTVVADVAIVIACFLAVGGFYALNINRTRKFLIIMAIIACSFVTGALFGAADVLAIIRERKQRKGETTPLIAPQVV